MGDKISAKNMIFPWHKANIGDILPPVEEELNRERGNLLEQIWYMRKSII